VSYKLSRRCLTNRFHKWLLVSYKLSRACLTNRFHKWLLVSYKLSRACLTNRFHKWLLVSYKLSRACLTLATNKLGWHSQKSPPRDCNRHSFNKNYHFYKRIHEKTQKFPTKLGNATARSKNKIKELSLKNKGSLPIAKLLS
jgi:hypothetical protein